MKHTYQEGLARGEELGQRVTIAGTLLPRSRAKLLFDRVRASGVRHLTLDGRVVHPEDVQLDAARSFDALEHLELVGFESVPAGLLTAQLPSLRTLVVRSPELSDDDRAKLAQAAYATQIDRPAGEAIDRPAVLEAGPPSVLQPSAVQEAVERLWTRLTELGVWIPEGFSSDEAMQADGRIVVVNGFEPGTNRIEQRTQRLGFVGNHGQGFAWIHMGSRRGPVDAFRGSWTQLWTAAQRWADAARQPLPGVCTVFGRVDGCAVKVPHLAGQPHYTQSAKIGAKIDPWALWFPAGPLVVVAPDHPAGAVFLGETPLGPDLAWYLTQPAPAEISLPAVVPTDTYAVPRLPEPLVGAAPADAATADHDEGPFTALVAWDLDHRDTVRFSGTGNFLLVVRGSSLALIAGRGGRPRRVRLPSDGPAYALHPHRDEIWTFTKAKTYVTHLDTGRSEARPAVSGSVRVAAFTGRGGLVVGAETEYRIGHMSQIGPDGTEQVLAKLPGDLVLNLGESILLADAGYLAQRVSRRLAVFDLGTAERRDLDAPPGYEFASVFGHPQGQVLAALCRQQARREYRMLVLDAASGAQLGWLPAGRFQPDAVEVTVDGTVLWINDGDVEVAKPPYENTDLLHVPPDQPRALCAHDGELGVGDSERTWWLPRPSPHGRLRYPWVAEPTFSAGATAVAASDRFRSPGTLQLETGVLLLTEDPWPDAEVVGVSDDGECIVFLRPSIGARVYRRAGESLVRHWSYPGNVFSAGVTGDGRHVALAEQMDLDDGTTSYVCAIIDLEAPTFEPVGFLVGMAKGRVLTGIRGVTYTDALSSSDWKPGQTGPVTPRLNYHEDVLAGLDSIEQLEMPCWVDRTAMGVTSIFRDGSAAFWSQAERTPVRCRTLDSLTSTVQARSHHPAAGQLLEALNAIATLPRTMRGEILQATVDREADALAIRVGRVVRCYPFHRGEMAFEAEVGGSSVVAWAHNLTLAVVNLETSEAYFLKVDGI